MTQSLQEYNVFDSLPREIKELSWEYGEMAQYYYLERRSYLEIVQQLKHDYIKTVVRNYSKDHPEAKER